MRGCRRDHFNRFHPIFRSNRQTFTQPHDANTPKNQMNAQTPICDRPTMGTENDAKACFLEGCAADSRVGL